MPVQDKLSLINQCLLLKGQNTVAAEDDGSPEWNVASAAYELWLPALLEDGEYKFSTEIVELSRVGDSPDAHYDDAYAIPGTCRHLISVKIEDVPQEYRIVGNQVLLSCEASDEVMAKIVIEPDSTEFSSIFVAALSEFVNSGIESGLKKDQSMADRHIAKGDALAQRAKTRGDQQEPKKSFFKTRHRTARMVRRG
jgi:hypothetical protein